MLYPETMCGILDALRKIWFLYLDSIKSQWFLPFFEIAQFTINGRGQNFPDLNFSFLSDYPFTSWDSHSYFNSSIISELMLKSENNIKYKSQHSEDQCQFHRLHRLILDAYLSLFYYILKTFISNHNRYYGEKQKSWQKYKCTLLIMIFNWKEGILRKLGK